MRSFRTITGFGMFAQGGFFLVLCLTILIGSLLNLFSAIDSWSTTQFNILNLVLSLAFLALCIYLSVMCCRWVCEWVRSIDITDAGEVIFNMSNQRMRLHASEIASIRAEDKGESCVVLIFVTSSGIVPVMDFAQRDIVIALLRKLNPEILVDLNGVGPA